MAQTAPDELWSPDLSNNFAWVSHLALMQQTVQAALIARANKVGTSAQRQAWIPSAKTGDMWYDVDTKSSFIWSSGAWIEVSNVPAYALGTRTTNQTLGSSTSWTDVIIDALPTSKGLTLNTSHYLEVQTGGHYLVGGQVRYSSNANGVRALQLFNSDNSRTVTATNNGISGSPATVSATGMMFSIEPGETIGMRTWQNSGVSLPVSDAQIWAVRLD